MKKMLKYAFALNTHFLGIKAKMDWIGVKNCDLAEFVGLVNK